MIPTHHMIGHVIFPIPNRCWVLVLMLCWLLPAAAQTTKVSGVVSDAVTGELLPFVNVAFSNSRIATVTDIDGSYLLNTYYATDSISFQYLGYKSVTVGVKRDKAQVIDIKLETAGNELIEFKVTAKGENPAFIILRRTIANKPANNREKLSAYEYEAYNKIQFDLNNITEKFQKKKLFKPFAFVFDNIDSTDKKPSLPIFMTESLSEVYYRQKPKTRREVIRGTKVSGIENESVGQFMGDMYQNVNIYDNFLVIFGKNFISPIADGGRGYYDYFLTDSTWIGTNWCYKLEFKPKRPQELAFQGEMWINDTTYAVKRIACGIDKGANLNFVMGFAVKQEYSLVKPEVWMLTRDELWVDLNIIRDKEKLSKREIQGFYGRRTATYRDFKINEQREDAFYEGPDEVVMSIDPLSLGSDYWDTHRHEQLNKKEAMIYHMVDTMKTIPRFRTYVDLVTMIMTGYYVRGKIELGPYFTTYSFNPVEGSRFRIGGRTSNDFSKKVEFEGYTAYGTTDERFKFGLAVRGFITKRPRTMYRAGYKNDLEQLGQSVNAFRSDNILGSAFRRGPNTKLTNVEEWRGSLEREWFSGFSNEVMFRYRTLLPKGDLEYLRFDEEFDLESVGSIHTAELSLNTRFAYREKFISGEFDRISAGTRYPTLELHLAYGAPQLFKSDYEYTKAIGRIYKRWQLGTFGWTRTTFEGGRIWGTLPYPLLIIHSGNETYYYDDIGFNTMNFFEFISDRYAQVMAEHHFEGLFFNRVPLFRRLKWREVATFKGVVGALDPKHASAMLFLPGMFDLSGGPFMEASVGIENILKMLRVDIVWRLRYLENPNTAPFAIRGKIFINF
ncbi:MAG: DUF5686 family protein [Flavobacteriales bacterium]